MEQFRGGLVFKAHRLLYHSTLGLRVIKKKKKKDWRETSASTRVQVAWVVEFRVEAVGSTGDNPGANRCFLSQLPCKFFLPEVASEGD